MEKTKPELKPACVIFFPSKLGHLSVSNEIWVDTSSSADNYEPVSQHLLTTALGSESHIQIIHILTLPKCIPGKAVL